MQFMRFAVIGLLLFCSSGCGKKGENTVSGTVKFNGKPVYGGIVLLYFDNNEQSQGYIAIDGTGSYSVSTPFDGHAKIGVVSDKPADPKTKQARGAATVDPATLPDPAKWFEIPAKYADAATSGKETTVSSGKNTVDINLE